MCALKTDVAVSGRVTDWIQCFVLLCEVSVHAVQCSVTSDQTLKLKRATGQVNWALWVCVLTGFHVFLAESFVRSSDFSVLFESHNKSRQWTDVTVNVRRSSVRLPWVCVTATELEFSSLEVPALGDCTRL